MFVLFESIPPIQPADSTTYPPRPRTPDVHFSTTYPPRPRTPDVHLARNVKWDLHCTHLAYPGSLSRSLSLSLSLSIYIYIYIYIYYRLALQMHSLSDYKGLILCSKSQNGFGSRLTMMHHTSIEETVASRAANVCLKIVTSRFLKLYWILNTVWTIYFISSSRIFTVWHWGHVVINSHYLNLSINVPRTHL